MSSITSLLGDFGWIIGGGGVLALAALIMIDVPAPFKPWAIALLAAAAGFGAFKIEEANYEECQASVAKFQAAAQAAASKALADAKEQSDKDLAALQKQLDDQSRNFNDITSRLQHDAVNKNCPPSPAARDASQFVRRVIANPGGGQAPAQRSPTPRVSGPPAGTGPADRK